MNDHVTYKTHFSFPSFLAFYDAHSSAPSKRRAILRVWAAFVLLLGLGLSCSKTDKASSIKLVVTYAGPESQLERAGKTRALKRGDVLGASDTVITGGQGAVDLQSSRGAVIRIPTYSRVRISELSKNTSLELKQGALMARIDKKDSSEGFEVKTPTLVAGVRGTTFRVKESGVKVISGKVVVRPRIPALEQKSKEEIASDPSLQKLEANLKAQETVLEPGQIAELPESRAQELGTLNDTIASGASLSLKADKNNAEPLQGKVLQVKSEGVDLRDKAEATTMISIQSDLIDELAQKGSASEASKEPDWTQPKIAELEREYNQKRDAAVDDFEKKNIQKGSLSDEKAIRKEYEVVEYIHLRGGEVYVGAVLAQAGGILLVHSADGLKRVPVLKVNYIDYK